MATEEQISPTGPEPPEDGLEEAPEPTAAQIAELRELDAERMRQVGKEMDAGVWCRFG